MLAQTDPTKISTSRNRSSILWEHILGPTRLYAVMSIAAPTERKNIAKIAATRGLTQNHTFCAAELMSIARDNARAQVCTDSMHVASDNLYIPTLSTTIYGVDVPAAAKEMLTLSVIKGFRGSSRSYFGRSSRRSTL